MYGYQKNKLALDTWKRMFLGERYLIQGKNVIVVRFTELWLRKSPSEAIGEEDIESLVSNNIEENLNLEYKSIGAIKSPKILRKEIAAFANSDGGLLIVGISDPKSGSKHLPGKIEWIDDPKITKDTLQDLTINQIHPSIPNVLIIPVPSKAKTKIFMIDVPRSDTPPHMADGFYYYRAGSQTRRMDHYQVADLFGKRRRPILKPFIRITSFNGENYALSMKYGYSNEGRALAKWPMIHMSFWFCIVKGQENPPMWESISHSVDPDNLKRTTINHETLASVLHPRMENALSTLSVELTEKIAVGEIMVGAEDSPTDTYMAFLSRNWLDRRARELDRGKWLDLPLLKVGEEFSSDDLEKWGKEFKSDLRDLNEEERVKYGSRIAEVLASNLMPMLYELLKESEATRQGSFEKHEEGE